MIDALRRRPARGRWLALALLSVIVLATIGVPAFAEDGAPPPASGGTSPVTMEHSPDWAAHPGAGVAAAFGVALLVLAAFVGVGCATAVLGALFPRLAAAAVDRQARATSPTAPLLVGSLVLLGVAAIVAGAAHGGHAAGGLAFLLLGLPAVLLVFAGSMATIPLLGERILGARGSTASPLRRGVVGSVALGLGALPGVVAPHLLVLLTFVVLMAATGWPLGVGLSALLARWRRSLPASTPSSASPASTSDLPPPPTARPTI